MEAVVECLLKYILNPGMELITCAASAEASYWYTCFILFYLTSFFLCNLSC